MTARTGPSGIRTGYGAIACPNNAPHVEIGLLGGRSEGLDDIGLLGEGFFIAQQPIDRFSEYAKFAPLGTRGVGYGRTQGYAGATNSFFETENLRRHCYAMIETATAFEAAAAIAALPCVDGLFIGPADLSMARGRGAFAATDADLDDLRHIAAVTAGAGKRWAVPAANPRLRETALPLAPSFVMLGDDLSALSAGLSAMIGSLPGRR